MQISTDKLIIVKRVMSLLYEGRKQYITVGGYAGTGKTLLISLLAREIRKHYKSSKRLGAEKEKQNKLKRNKNNYIIAFCSYTGKASQVLHRFLIENKAIEKYDSISTIHGLIYEPIVNRDEEIIGWERKDLIKADLIIVDEASMVDEKIWNDLLEYKKPIIAVGDHGQLPPVNGDFNLMQKPDYTLEYIYRQQRGNPIIELSIMARTKGEIPIGNYSDKVRKFSRLDTESQEILEDLLGSYNTETLVLCGYNKTRIKLNEFIRKSIGFNSYEPQEHDRVICLRNNHKKQIFNGMTGTIEKMLEHDEDWYYAEILFDSGLNFQGLIQRSQFGSETGLNFTSNRSRTLAGDLFDWGYALTVHKAQGSQAERVILLEERFPRMSENDWRRWLYTAVTRAQEELYIF